MYHFLGAEFLMNYDLSEVSGAWLAEYRTFGCQRIVGPKSVWYFVLFLALPQKNIIVDPIPKRILFVRETC